MSEKFSNGTTAELVSIPNEELTLPMPDVVIEAPIPLPPAPVAPPPPPRRTWRVGNPNAWKMVLGNMIQSIRARTPAKVSGKVQRRNGR